MTSYTPHKKKLNFDIIESPSKHASPVSSLYKHVSPVSVSEPNLNVTMSPQSSPTFNIHDPRILQDRKKIHTKHRRSTTHRIHGP